jgi:hypothetical protein
LDGQGATSLGDDAIQPDEVQVKEFLRGLLKSYSRKAA